MYLWLVALHLISIVCWFAALFYLPRLFVYHAMSDDRISIDRFVLMERKLYFLIANPAMFGTIGFGIWLFLLAPSFYLNLNLHDFTFDNFRFLPYPHPNRFPKRLSQRFRF